MDRSNATRWFDWRKFLRDESGPAATEYALMLAVVAFACIGAISALGNSVGGTMTTMSNELSAALGV